MKELRHSYPGHWIDLTIDGFARSGEPDIIGCYCGRYIAMELKHNDRGYDVEEIQQYKLNDIKNNGGVALSVYSLEDLKLLDTL